MNTMGIFIKRMYANVFLICAVALVLGQDELEFDESRLNFTDAQQEAEFREVVKFKDHSNINHYIIDTNNGAVRAEEGPTLLTPIKHKFGSKRSSKLSPYQQRILERLPKPLERSSNADSLPPNSLGSNAFINHNAEIDPKRTFKTFHPYDLDIKTRVKRFNINQKVYWDTNNITWTLFSEQLPDGISRNEISEELNDAFLLWQKTTSWQDNETILYFTQLNDNEKSANIKISFEKRRHDDSYPFDGTGGVLGHAFPPRDGRLHLDLEEEWLLTNDDKTQNGTYLLPVVAHEIGHCLGLSHSTATDALMFPWYRENVKSLGNDDRNGLDQLYVHNPYKSDTTEAPNEDNLFSTLPEWVTEETPNSLLPICDSFPDTVACIRKEYYVFKDGTFWRFRNSSLFERNMLGGESSVGSIWKEMCGVDAVVEIENKILFIHKGVWYEYVNDKLIGVGLVADMFVAEKSVAVKIMFREEGYLYLVDTNSNVYRAEIKTKKVVNKMLLKDKFKGVGTSISWISSDTQGAKKVGIGRGVWRLKIVETNRNLGHVYRVAGEIEPLVDTC